MTRPEPVFECCEAQIPWRPDRTTI